MITNPSPSSQSMDLVSRGKRIVLEYTGGSPCGPQSSSERRDAPLAINNDEPPYSLDHEIESVAAVKEDNRTRRKSTIIAFVCDHNPGSTQASLSFIGTDPDECSYFFDARSIHACASAEPHQPGSVGPGSVFGLILIIKTLTSLLND